MFPPNNYTGHGGHLGGHLGFLGKLQGYTSTPSWFLISTIISIKKNAIKWFPQKFLGFRPKILFGHRTILRITTVKIRRLCDYNENLHFIEIIMSAMASKITCLTIVYSTVYSGADQRKHQSSASLAFVLGIHRSPVNSPHKWPVTRKMFPFDDVIISTWKYGVYIEPSPMLYCNTRTAKAVWAHMTW